MTKEEILKYATESPQNTNKAVLSTMLDSFGVADNKTEIELLAQENKIYTPAEGKVYNKVTVDVPPTPLDTITITENGESNAQEGRGFKKVITNVHDVIPVFTLEQVDENNYTITSTVVYGDIIDKGYDNCKIIVPGSEAQYDAVYSIVNNLTQPYMTKSIMITQNMGHALGNGTDFNSYPLMFRTYCAAPDSNDRYLWHLKATDIRDLGSIQ